jgi:hypothetical protein
MKQEDLDLLTEKLVEAQALEASEAYELAVKIGTTDREIAEAAMEWCRTGIMPSKPVIEGESPKSLDLNFYPSQTFTALIAMRREGTTAHQRLGWLPGRHRRPGSPH